MRWVAFALAAFVTVVRADFVAPAEGPLPFRRDKLPVDVDTISSLSRQVTVLTGADLKDDPADLRAAAQMTALALALDPANRQARDLLDELRAGGTPEKADKQDLRRTCSRVWQVLGWLEMPEAGADGQALAACLGDVLAVADPEHPRSKERLEAGEKGAWKDWIAPEAAFRKKEVKPEPEEDPAPMEEEKAQVPTVALRNPPASVRLWAMDKELKKEVLQTVTLEGRVTPGSESGKLEIHWGFEAAKAWAASSKAVASALTLRHGGLEGGLSVNLDLKAANSYDPVKNGAILSGTAAVLIDSALTGNRSNATAVAVVGEDGKLQLPPGFWATLRAISAQKNSGRLILPAKAEPFLEALLVLGEPGFFMDHEVLLATTVDDLCDLAAGVPKAPYAENLQAFEEIWKVGQGKSIGSFVAHPATQARLNKIGTAMPRHASARLLALQGSGNRPRFLQRPILAREIRDALAPIQHLRDESTGELLSQQLDQIHEACRKKLDEILNVIEIRDRDLHKSATALADSVRTLARTIDKEERDEYYSSEIKSTQMLQTISTDYVNLLRTLTEAAGDGTEFIIPKLNRDR